MWSTEINMRGKYIAKQPKFLIFLLHTIFDGFEQNLNVWPYFVDIIDFRCLIYFLNKCCTVFWGSKIH